jgi:peroxiredoxin family protein
MLSCEGAKFTSASEKKIKASTGAREREKLREMKQERIQKWKIIACSDMKFIQGDVE